LKISSILRATVLFERGIVSTSFELLSPNITPTPSFIAESTKHSPIVCGLPAFAIRKLFRYEACIAFSFILVKCKSFLLSFSTLPACFKKLEWLVFQIGMLRLNMPTQFARAHALVCKYFTANNALRPWIVFISIPRKSDL
jgi:hypothetical protein